MEMCVLRYICDNVEYNVCGDLRSMKHLLTLIYEDVQEVHIYRDGQEINFHD